MTSLRISTHAFVVGVGLKASHVPASYAMAQTPPLSASRLEPRLPQFGAIPSFTEKAHNINKQ